MAASKTETCGTAATFSFGKNWQDFLKLYNEERVEKAKESLCEFMGVPDLKGKRFIDIGCGSGMFSLAAHRLGAEEVVSVDIDPLSVQCGRYLHDKEGKPSNWTVREGSALDKAFLNSLGTFDIVYSWGVLHHTGKMWEAIRNAAEMVRPGGLFYIAIYNKVEGPKGSEYWLSIKEKYNRGGPAVKAFYEWRYIAMHFIKNLVRFRNPMTEIVNYSTSKRGMSWRRDVTDWLGGYPYEYATTQELADFVTKEFPDFEVANVKPASGHACHWMLFRRKAAS